MSEFISRSPHHLKRALIKAKDAYVETIGKQDIESLADVIAHPDGGGTVVRQIFGATEDMPFRALTYLASAARVAQIIPCEQLQIVGANHLGATINDVPRERSRSNTNLLAAVGMRFLNECMPDVAEKTVFAEDTMTPLIDFIRPLTERVIDESPEIKGSLSRKGNKHGSDFVSYGAAHTAYQDTRALRLEPLLTEQDVVRSDRIVTVGCQQERLFYNLRMGVRELMPEDVLIPSVQVFTRHVSPPYYRGKDPEQSLIDAFESTVDPLQFKEGTAAHRDVGHFLRTYFSPLFEEEL